MDNDKIIMILLVIIVILVIIGVILIISNQRNSADNTKIADNNTSSTVEKISSEDTVEPVSSSPGESLPYNINNLPPSNDKHPETKRYQIDQYTVKQEYSDGYHSYVDLRTGERHGGFGN